MTAANLSAATHITAGAIADRLQQAITATLLAMYPDDPEAAEAVVIAEADFISRATGAIGDRVSRSLVHHGRVPTLPEGLPVGRGVLSRIMGGGAL